MAAPVRLKVVSVAGASIELSLDKASLTLERLRDEIEKQLGLPREGLRLVLKGDILTSADQLEDGAAVLAMVVPRPPPQALRDLVDGGAEEEDERDLRYVLPANAPAWKKAVLAFVQGRLRVPNWVVGALVAPGPRFYLGLVGWAAGAKLASAYDLGPVFIVASLFALMLLNLGTRRPGQWSAYSVFNPGVRRLPGQLTADDLDRQIRRGGH